MRPIALVISVIVLSAAGGCAAPCDRARQVLANGGPEAKAGALHGLVQQGCPDATPLAIRALADEDEGVRFYAGAALFRLTGERLGFEPQGDPRARAEAVVRWIDWYVGSHPEAKSEFDDIRSQLAPWLKPLPSQSPPAAETSSPAPAAEGKE